MRYSKYDFTVTFDELHEYLDGMIDVAEDMFVQIKDREQIDFGRFCIAKLDELENLKKAAAALHDAMEKVRDELCLDAGYAKSTKLKSGLRKIEVEVTEGMIRQSLLSLTKAKKANLVALGEQFTIKIPNEGGFTTELIDPGNKLRERGRIRAFYEQHEIRPGDHIVLTEIDKGVWQMDVERGKGDPLSELLKTL